MLTLYSAPRTRSIRVAWLLEEMNQPYELVNGEFQQTGARFFLQSTPTGKYPTIEDDGVVMMESGAITEYLLDKYGNCGLRPERGTQEHAQYLQWLHYADATAFSPLGVVVWLSVYRDDADTHPQLIEDARERVVSAFAVLSETLRDKKYLLGEDFTAADIMMAFTLMAANMLGLLGAFPNLQTYLTRLLERPAFKQAAEKTNNQSMLASASF